MTQLTRAIETWGADRKQEYTFMMGLGSLPHYYGERAITYDWMGRYDDALEDWDAAIEFCRLDRPHDMPAYQVGRLATRIQSGAMTAEEAVLQVAAGHLADAPDETCLNRMYLFVRFYAIAAEHAQHPPQRDEYANRAIDLLDTFVHRSGPCFTNLRPENVDFDVLRSYPGYDALLQKIASWDTSPE